MPGNIPNQTPVFTYTPLVGTNQIFSGNAMRNGIPFTGAIYTICSGASVGTRVEYLQIKATGVITAGQVRFFIDNSKAGNFYNPNTGIFLWKELAIPATTPNTSTTIAYEAEILRPDGRPVMILNSGQILSATAEKGEGFNIFAFGGDY